MFGWSELTVILPEIIVVSMASVILIIDLYTSEQRRGFIHMLSMLTLVFAAIATLRPSAADAASGAVMALNGSFVRDEMGDVLKLFLYLVIGAVFIYAKSYLRDRDLFKSEFHVLCLFGMLGMMVMISAGSMLSLYLGLELLALSTYALIALDRDSGVASESAMKYFVLGAIASGMLLYGMSMIYGATGYVGLADIAASLTEIQAAGTDSLLVVFGLTFIVVGLAFKFGAVPFHMWLPDVYQGSSTAVTLYISGAPKIAAFAMAIRLLEDALGTMSSDWQQMLVVLCILSLALGNIVAIAQTNLKRMLAYSTISHVGFVLLGLLAGTESGREAAMFYAIVYSIMAVGAFGVIAFLSRGTFEAENLEDFQGLNQRSPWWAFIMLAFMASMAGFPPFIGFFAKVEVLKAAVDTGLVWLAAVAVAFAVIGAFYYLRVIKLMYMDKPVQDDVIDGSVDIKAALGINGLAQLAMGLFPGPLLALCATAMS